MDTHALPSSGWAATGGELLVRVCGASFSAHTGAHTVLVRRDADGATLDALTSDAVGDLDALRHIAEAWVAARIGADSALCTHCRSCGMAFGEPASVPIAGLGSRGPLTVTFCGGYGQYVDTGPGDERAATICPACADALCETHPWISELLEARAGTPG